MAKVPNNVMANPADGNQFTAFIDAFCHRYGCAPGDYERAALFRAVPAWKRPVVWLLLYINPDMFDLDLDIIEALGKTRNRDDFSGLLDEFHNAMRNKRSVAKVRIGLRMQGSRLMEIREELDSLIVPSPSRRNPSRSPRNAPVIAPTATPAQSPPTPGPGIPTRAALVPTESRALMLRKTRQTHAAITAGTPLAQALADNGLEEGQFLELLAGESAANLGFAWLREQLLKARRLEETEAEVARLNRAIADQSREIADLRERLSRPA
jgi:hypothetical protein